MILFTLILRNDKRMTSTAGNKVIQFSTKLAVNNCNISKDGKLLCPAIPINRYTTQVTMKGIAEVRIICLIFWKISVFVSVLTRSALVDMGEHLSPK